MRYKVVQALAPMAIGTDFEAAALELERRINEAMRDGWKPQGGVFAAHPLGGGQPTLLQAMIHDDAS